MDNTRAHTVGTAVRDIVCRRRFRRLLMERYRIARRGRPRPRARGIIQAQLRKKPGAVHRLQHGPRKGGDYNGRRPAGLTRRNTAPLPHDHSRRLRPRLWIQTETLRPPEQDNTHKTLQRHSSPRKRHPQPPRLQLRPQSLPRRGGEAHRGLRRHAPLYPISCETRRIP